MIDSFARIAFLKKIHLFYGIGDEKIAAIADQLVESQPYLAGTEIYRQGSKAENFYLIHSGNIKIITRKKGKDRLLANLVANDYFGELELVERRTRVGTASAVADTVLLSLPRDYFIQLLKQEPQLQSNLDLAVRSLKLVNSLQFSWLMPDEAIYFLARKHIIVLVKNLILPFLALFLPAILLYWWVASAPSFIVLFAASISLVLDILWAIWLVIDWGNDYYIVTNQRVVWLEKVIAVYDSRQESPLNTILAVAVETDLLGRWLDFGDVVVRTFVGKIIFRSVSHPKQAQYMIEEYWDRTKLQAVGLEKAAMKTALRKTLGLSVDTPPPTPAQQKADHPRERGYGRIARFFGADRLRLRYEEGDSVLYRKHWFVLLQQAWIPFLGTFFLVGLFLYRLYLLIQSSDDLVSTENGLTVDAYAGALFILFFIMLAWLIYEIADWSNDIYQVTNEQIIDMDKKPLGTQTRNVSQLENILGTESRRVGLLGELFNYGSVDITVGGTKLTFENVTDPSTVQSDIDRRRMAQKARKEEKDRAAKRDEMAGWLAIYHQNAEKFRREEDEQKKKSE